MHDSSVRQRQQGRDAAQLARRARCRACSTRSRSASRPARRASPCIRAPIGGTSRRTTCATIARLLRAQRPAVEFNIEGDPRPGAARARRKRCGPISARWCRSSPGEVTSQAGWQPGPATERAAGRRSPAARRAACGSACSSIRRRSRSAGRRRVGADRVELYTEPFARAFERGPDAAARVVRALRRGRAAGARARAGRQRRPRSRSRQPQLFRDLPFLDEVSIGHAIMSRALFVASRPSCASISTCSRCDDQLGCQHQLSALQSRTDTDTDSFLHEI